MYTAKNNDDKNCPWITFEDGMKHLPQAKWISAQTQTHNRRTSLIEVNDGEAVLACVKAGLGKSLLPIVVGGKHPDLRCLDERVCLSREIWLIVHPELRQLARIKTIMEWIKTVVKTI